MIEWIWRGGKSSKYLRGTVREIIGMRKGVKELGDSVWVSFRWKKHGLVLYLELLSLNGPRKARINNELTQLALQPATIITQPNAFSLSWQALNNYTDSHLTTSD